MQHALMHAHLGSVLSVSSQIAREKIMRFDHERIPEVHLEFALPTENGLDYHPNSASSTLAVSLPMDISRYMFTFSTMLYSSPVRLAFVGLR